MTDLIHVRRESVWPSGAKVWRVFRGSEPLVDSYVPDDLKSLLASLPAPDLHDAESVGLADVDREWQQAICPVLAEKYGDWSTPLPRRGRWELTSGLVEGGTPVRLSLWAGHQAAPSLSAALNRFYKTADVSEPAKIAPKVQAKPTNAAADDKAAKREQLRLVLLNAMSIGRSMAATSTVVDALMKAMDDVYAR